LVTRREIIREHLRELILRALEGTIAAAQVVDATVASRDLDSPLVTGDVHKGRQVCIRPAIPGDRQCY